MSDLSKEFHVDKNSEMGWMGQQLANRGIVCISFDPEQPARMIIKAPFYYDEIRKSSLAEQRANDIGILMKYRPLSFKDPYRELIEEIIDRAIAEIREVEL